MHKLLMFNSEKLLQQALTHRSYVNEHPAEMHNERLEFLGDAILNFLSGEYLYQRHPEMGEDEMTRRQSALVDEKQLARFATDVGLDFRMRLGQGAIREGGFQNPNLLSSTFEAVVGAYYLDSDRNVDILRPLIKQLFDSVPQEVMALRSNVDPKNQLQGWSQSKFGVLPTYNTQPVGGLPHLSEWAAEVFINGELYGTGRGCGKKTEAEKQAAEDALISLKKQELL